MIPRYQRILFWILVGGIAIMAGFLLHGCHEAHKRLATHNDDTPISATFSTSTEDIAFYLANDADGSISSTQQPVALPQDPTVRARIILEHLLAGYSAVTSSHPLQSGPAVDDVYILDPPANNSPDAPTSPSGQLAVINLHGSFADNHPSGVQVENLTILSIIGTLHAAFPQVTQIRLPVDGQPRDTLAGHADLQRVYPAADTTSKPAQPQPVTDDLSSAQQPAATN
jgi:Sporulation and spore germination